MILRVYACLLSSCVSAPRERKKEKKSPGKEVSTNFRGKQDASLLGAARRMAENGEEPGDLDFESSRTKLQRARAELEEARAVQKLEADNRTGKAHTKLEEARAELAEARAAAKLEAVTRAENHQIKLEEARRAQHLQIELEEARAKLEQRVQAELEKARAARIEEQRVQAELEKARAAWLGAKQKNPKLVAAEDRRAQRGARLAAHASREWTGVLEDVPESPPRKGTGQLADEQPENHADSAFPEPARLRVPSPPAVLFKQNPSTFEAVPSIPAALAAKAQTAIERKVEISPYSAAAVFSEDSPHSITADFFTPTRTPAMAKKEVVTAHTIAFIDGEQSMLERFETFLKSSERAEEVVVVGQEVVVYESPKSEEDACIDEEQSMCVRLESFLAAVMEQNGFIGSSYSPYVEGPGLEKRTRCGCI